MPSNVCLTFDFDTVTVWLAGGHTSPTPISRGEFGLVGAERLLKLLDRLNITTTWYIPGQTIDLYEDACRAVAEAGHEIAHHGYEHVSPASLTRIEEADQLKRGNDAIARICGAPATGYRSPAWDLSPHSIDLLLEAGFSYDSSMMGHDYVPYFARRGDVVENGHITFGSPSSLLELPISWSLDDYPHFEWIRGGGLKAAGGVLDNWMDDYRYMRNEQPDGVLTYTCHPFVIGRGHRMMMLERLLTEMLAEDACFITAAQAATIWRDRLENQPR
jgi:peptidoglycan/xylan/chitin deacetylase (PgdA/CDA1 family)